MNIVHDAELRDLELSALRSRWDALKGYLDTLASGPGQPGEWEGGYDAAVSDILDTVKELEDADDCR